MAGYGNRNAPDITPADLEHEHTNTRFGRDDVHAYTGGHETYGSGSTGGAGFGNKSAPDSTQGYDNSDLRFDSHHETGPYKGHKERNHGSGAVGGAGYGNKTGSFSESHDSTMGRIMEKAGHMMHNEKLAVKGRERRESSGYAPEAVGSQK
ncbi:hypothetical protein P280DRAFT_506782 [Massarina eburnea CBS 473.64]|uniref:Uncharacterized protein n=1 Tax=Massarina eburnea CBS 473.64 TaxID=1395130 RepID=A0A6A6S204_9PLEO|nr:hypothetical protein P280DRAFT_506782 [Massarina eburnea CBS 473.64]